MEEILASIRRIISDDESTAGPKAGQGDPAESDPAKPAPLAKAPEPEPAPGGEDEVNSQDDIDALFAADAPASETDDDIFELTPDMKASEDEPAPKPNTPAPEAEADAGADMADWGGDAVAEPAMPVDNDVIFKDETPEPRGEEARAPQAEAPFAQAGPDMPAADLADMVRERVGERIETETATRLDGRLLSPDSDAAVSSAFSNLASLILSKDARTLEDLVQEMLRPMLKAWLDENLPSLVERLVREEIERVSRAGRR